MENFRLFLGIALSNDVSRQLAAIAGRLERELGFRSWTHPDDYHVTLHFLGDTPSSRVDAIADAARTAAAERAPLALALGEPGTFGPPHAPRVLWCGARETAAADAGALAALHAALGERLAAACGFAPEARPLRAHVTLARQARGGAEPAAIAAAWRQAAAQALAPGAAGEALAWTAGGVTLFRSHLGRRPSYERLLELPFAGR